MISQKMLQILLKNKITNRDDDGIVFAKKNQVNLNYWCQEGRSVQNIGDWLSEIIVEKVAQEKGIDIHKRINSTKHLYAIGSILLGYRDCTVWGSGFSVNHVNDRNFHIYSWIHRHWHTTDVRAVRGPETKKILDSMGIPCPSIFGDPALLMPLFFQPTITDKRPYILVPHYTEHEYYAQKVKETGIKTLSAFTNDYKKFIQNLCSAEVVFSSSLHGIILADAYGIPSVLLAPKNRDLLKYRDYYESTGRDSFPCAESLEEAIYTEPSPIPFHTIKNLQDGLLDAFPADLWE